MKFNEHTGKKILSEFGIPIPVGHVVATPDEAHKAANNFEKVMVKAQVPEGKRGKAGGIKVASTPSSARNAAASILGMKIGGSKVTKLLIEEVKPVEREFYLAIFSDQKSKGPILLFSPFGGVEVEENTEENREILRSISIDIRYGLSEDSIFKMLSGLDIVGLEQKISVIFLSLYKAYLATDAELLEINPLGLVASELIALDCKFVMDDSGIKRQKNLVAFGSSEKLTILEQEAQTLGLKYIELDGDIGVLANGAGLTMTTMDVVRSYGGKPANFLEIGGDAYTKSRDALTLVLKNKNIKSLVINFCGAFARTDIMTEGIVNAIKELKPTLPIFWSVHGTGDTEAIAMLRTRLGIEPFETMNAASEAAVKAAKIGT